MQLGSRLPVFFQLSDYANNKFVRAWLRDYNGDAIAGSPVNLSLQASRGYYGNSTLVMPNTPWVDVEYAVYDDSGYTTLSASTGDGTALFELSAVPQVQRVVGFVQCCDEGGDANTPNAFSIFLGNAKTMFLKTLQGSNFDPLDLTNCTEIDVRLPNADGTFTHFLLSLGDVAITDPSVLGKFSVPIDEDTSALLNVGQFQSFDVTFTISSEKFTVAYNRGISVYEV